LFEGDAAPAVPALIKLIGDKEPTVTLEAVWVYVSKALASIGSEHVLEPLIAAIPESDRITYYGITATISEFGAEAKSHAPVFIDLLKNGPENRRWVTMYTLSNFGDAALPAIPEYIKNLDHREFNFQVMACRALAKLGPASKEAVPKLVELTGKENMLSTRTHAAMCLGAIGPVNGVDWIQIFTDMINEPNAFSQERGLIALGRLGRHAEKTRGFVEGLLKQEEFSQKPEAARTLWQITGENKPTLKILTKLIDNPTYDTRVHGILKEMGPDAAPVSKLLADKLKTDDQSLQQVLIGILVAMGPAAKEHVEAIRGALEGADPDTALFIDQALAKIETM
jgi:HEAT repeat protein